MRNMSVGMMLVGMTAIAASAHDSNEKTGPAADRPALKVQPEAVRVSDDSHHRLVWEQSDRLCQYVDKGEDGWVELDKDGKVFLRFRELRRNIDFVDLLDQSRGYHLRLYKNAMFIKGGNDGFQKFEDFTKYYDGSWVK